MTTDPENDFHQLLVKAERFCAYQERCSHEIKQKMKEWGADEKETERIISSLASDDFLNEERFAKLFTSGKFRIKKWGKNKIRAALKMKEISDSVIKNALDEMDENEYRKTIQHLIKKKEKEVKSQKSEVRSQKIYHFLLSKGFEHSRVMQVLKGDSSLCSE